MAGFCCKFVLKRGGKESIDGKKKEEKKVDVKSPYFGLCSGRNFIPFSLKPSLFPTLKKLCKGWGYLSQL